MASTGLNYIRKDTALKSGRNSRNSFILGETKNGFHVIVICGQKDSKVSWLSFVQIYLEKQDRIIQKENND